MITKDEAVEITRAYLKERNREFDEIVGDIARLEKKEVIYGNLDYEEEHEMWIITYEIEGWEGPDPYFVHIKAATGDVYYTMTKHGYVEDWEEDENGNLLKE